MGLRLPSHWFGGIPGAGQWVAWGIFVALAVIGATPIGPKVVWVVGRGLHWVGRRRAAAVAAVGALALGLQVMIGLVAGMPEPAVHDEFSYLLAADTFAHGRLTNPSPPMADAFASMHILVRPTYQSKYPPGPGLAMALGEVVIGLPILGVWLCVAGACAGMTWMLLAWVPGRWAVAGGLLAAIHPQMLNWGQSYWGGAMAMMGGTMVVGGYGRIVRRGVRGAAAEAAPTRLVFDAVVLGLGAGVLANTRPFEGLLVCIVIGVGLAVWAMRVGIRGAASALWPAAVVVAGVGLWMGYYNWRVTGHVLETPYSLHERQYGITPHWVWGKLRPSPPYPNPILREFHEKWEWAQWRMQQTVGGWMGEAGSKVIQMAAWAAEPAGMIAAIMALPWVWRKQKWSRVLLGACVVAGGAELGVTWYLWPHYLAPAVGAWAAVAMAGLMWISGKCWGKWALWMVGVTAIFAAVRTTQLLELRQHGFGTFLALWQGRYETNPGKHLMIVRYVEGHNGHDEWVYNGADLESQKVIWAHDMGPDRNRELARTFKGRSAWLVRIGNGPVGPPEPVNP